MPHWIKSCLFASAILLTTAANAAPGNYQQMIAEAKSGKASIDFRALREAYANSPDYDPYGLKIASSRDAMMEAYERKDCRTALDRAQEILAVDFVQIYAHFVSALCYGDAGDTAAETFERKIADGLVQSILGSGDGKRPSTAYEVVALDEEYFILDLLELDAGMQALIRDDGHSYDRIDAVASHTGQKRTIFFNVDYLLGALDRELKSGTK
jgi:uncharacterized protein DUF4919